MLSSGDDRLCQSSSSVGLERVANAGVDDPALVQTVAEAIFNIDKPKGIINNFGLSPEANVVPASLVVDGEAFFLLQRLAMDKAERFQKMAEQVRVGNKFIDESERRPVSNFGLQTVDRQAEARRLALLEKISQSTGLFFFFKADCPYCEKQAPLLKHISETNHFDVLAISVGGGNLRTTTFENTVVDSGQAEMLSVESTPSIFLVHPESTTFALIGSSLLTVPEIQDRILLIAQRNNWVTEDEINATRPRLLNASGVDLSKELPRMLKAVQEDPNKITDLLAVLDGRDPVGERERLTKLPEQKKWSLMDEDGFIDPKNILAIIKSTGADQEPQD